MKRAVLWLTIMVLFAACENSANPLGGILGGGGGGAITPAQATGNWSFTVTRTTTLPCSNALSSGVVITARLVVQSDGTVSGTTSSWLNPISGAVEPLSGPITLTNAHTDLTFTTLNSNAAMELIGTMSSSGTFTGTLTDPEFGFLQVFGSDGCEYSVSGIKTG